MMKLVSLIFGLFRQQPTATCLSDTARTSSLDLLERHGLRAHYYLPAIGMEDRELANACRRLASAGYIITTRDGTITGNVASARPTKDEQIAMRRASFKLVESE